MLIEKIIRTRPELFSLDESEKSDEANDSQQKASYEDSKIDYRNKLACLFKCIYKYDLVELLM